MARHTPETLLISAALNSHDPYFWRKWGLSSKHFHGYRDQAEWVETFGTDFARTPNWEEFLSQWSDFPPAYDQDDGKYPASEVVKQYNTRVSTRTMLKASNLIKSGEVEDGLETLRLMDIHEVIDAPQNVLSDMSLLSDYQAPQDRVVAPWRSLQSRTMGIGKGELWYIAARPSQGKSIHTALIAANAAMQGRRVILYSMEMTKEAVTIRLQVMLAHMLGIKGVSHNKIRARKMDPRDYKAMVEQIAERVPGTIHVHTPAEGPCRPGVVSARAADYDLNVVDYIGLMRPDGTGRAVDDWRTIAAMSNELKEIALARNTRMVVASQINRDGEHSSKPPKLSQMSQSDALGQDGDVVLTLTKYKRLAGATHFSIEKNREGEAGVQFFSKFDVDAGDYAEISRQEADDEAADNEYDD